MCRLHTNAVRLTALLAVLDVARASAQSETTINFENLAVGTVVTTQYEGLTVSTGGNSCGDNPVVRAVIVTPSGGTSSPTKGLGIQTGCPDFSPDYLRLVFDQGHQQVSFTLGDFAGTFALRGYTTTSGAAGQVFTQNVVLEGTGSVGVHRLVTITRPTADLRRVEIDSTVDSFEVLDDLTFDCPDSTAPTAAITSPTGLACVCNSSRVIGSAHDADGDIANFRLQRKAPDASTWTLIRSTSTEVLDGELAVWTTAAPQGYYALRLIVTNKCGLTADAETVVWLDKNIDTVSISEPLEGDVVGGVVCTEGTIADHCGGNFTLEHRPAGGAFTPFTTVSPLWVTNDLLGKWNTAGSLDGVYEIRAAGADDCGNTGSAVRSVTVDNTPPTAVISRPVACDCVNGQVEVGGTADDAHFGTWKLQYTGGDQRDWVTIASGNARVVDGLLGLWDTRALPECEYTLRLLVTDTSTADCADVHQTEYLLPVEVGPCYDFDTDDDGDVDLIDYATFERTFTGP